LKINLNYSGNSVLFCITTLCSYGDSGDFAAFPVIPLNLSLIDFGKSIRSLCEEPVRYNESRIFLIFKHANITVFKSGRMILEAVSPDAQRVAGNIILELFSIYDSYINSENIEDVK